MRDHNRWFRFKRAFRQFWLGDVCPECLGIYRYTGESGFMVCRIHERCDGCGKERYYLLEH